MADSPNRSEPGWWVPVWELVVHVWVGSFLFAFVFAPAVGLDLLIKWLEEKVHVSTFLIVLLFLTKIAIGVLDALLYLVFMLRMGLLFVRKLWSREVHDA